MNDEIFLRCKCVYQLHWVEPIAVENGLAVTPFVWSDCSLSADRFVITHIPTGLKLGDGRFTRNEALTMLTKIAPLTDWGEVRSGDSSLDGLRDKIQAVIEGKL